MSREIIEKHVLEVSRLLESFRNSADRFFIGYHGDCDGLVSAVLFGQAVEEYLNKSDLVFVPVRTEEFDFVNLISAVKAARPDVTVVLDLSIQDYPERLEAVAKA